MIRLEGVTKRYGRLLAVDGLTCTAQRGECCVLLGPNGAGKTTTFRLLTTLTALTAGRAEVADYDVATAPLEVRRRIGYLPEVPPSYPEMTVESYLRFVAGCRGLTGAAAGRQVGRVIDRCSCGEVQRRLIGNLSKGYRQRVGLAQALLGEPEVLLLDEPTLGLDPPQAAEMRACIRELAAERTVLLSTHILSEAAALGQRVLIMHRGRLVADATPERLALAVAGNGAFTVNLRRPTPDVVDTLTAIPGFLRVLADGDGRYLIETRAEVDCREEIAARAVQQGWGLLALSPLTTPLEETFLRLIREAEETPR
jgi:gliding motility-associated transport system ATP-binding protein